jgi:hypothetical protein
MGRPVHQAPVMRFIPLLIKNALPNQGLTLADGTSIAAKRARCLSSTASRDASLAAIGIVATQMCVGQAEPL